MKKLCNKTGSENQGLYGTSMVLVHNICLVMLAVEQAGHLYENTTISMTKDMVSNTSLEVLLAAAAINQR